MQRLFDEAGRKREQRIWIVNLLTMAINPQTERAENISIGGVSACRNAFAAVIGSQTRWIRDCEDEARSGNICRGIVSRPNRKAPKAEKCIQFANDYIEEVGDKSPVADCWYLPIESGWKWMFRCYKEKSRAEGWSEEAAV